MVNNIKNNTISEINAKKNLNALNEVKKAELIKYKKHTPGLKKLFDLLDIILTDKTLESQENKKVKSKKEENKDYENEYENEDEDYENEYEYEDYENENEDEDYDETIDQNKIIKEKKWFFR